MFPRMTDEIKRPKRPRDTNQLAKNIVDIATGELSDDTESVQALTPEQQLGRIGGLKGGRARAQVLTPERRSEIAREASHARWSKHKDE